MPDGSRFASEHVCILSELGANVTSAHWQSVTGKAVLTEAEEKELDKLLEMFRRAKQKALDSSDTSHALTDTERRGILLAIINQGAVSAFDEILALVPASIIESSPVVSKFDEIIFDLSFVNINKWLGIGLSHLSSVDDLRQQLTNLGQTWDLTNADHGTLIDSISFLLSQKLFDEIKKENAAYFSQEECLLERAA